MKIKLGDQDSDLYFTFKVGDKVRLKHGRITGTVIAGHCYLDSELSSVFYTVKTRFGPTQTFRQGDIELHRILSCQSSTS
jgi:hypothetical protein